MKLRKEGRLLIPTPKEFFYISLMLIVLYAGGYGPVLWNYYHPIDNRTYLGFQTTAIDPLGNLALVQRGYGGEWTMRFIGTTTMDEKPLFVKTEYFLIGHIARWLNLDPFIFFKICIVISNLLLLTTYWFLIAGLFRSTKARLTALFITLFVTGVVIPGLPYGWLKAGGEELVFERLTVLRPHYVLGGLFSTIAGFIFIKYWYNRSSRRIVYLLAASIFGLLSSQVFSPGNLITISAITLFVVVFLFMNIIQKGWRELPAFIKSVLKNILGYILFSVVSAIPLLYLLIISKTKSMGTVVNTELLFDPKLVFWDYPLLIGPVLLIVLLGFKILMDKKNHYIGYLFCWILMHFIMTLAMPRLNISGLRALQTPYYFYYAVLATVVISEIDKLLSARIPRISYRIITAVAVIAFLCTSIFTYKFSLYYLTRRTPWEFYDYGYPYSDDVVAMKWMAKNIPPRSVVLSEIYPGTVMIALAPVDSYVNSWSEHSLMPTNMLMEPARNLYKQNLSDADARDFLHNNKIDYVYYGMNEVQHTIFAVNKKEITYPVLKEIYRYHDVRIYKVL